MTRDLSDVELVAQLHADPNALDVFYRRYAAQVASFAARRCRTPDAVADAVSATFIRAIIAAPGFDPRKAGGSARWWLLGIARHEIIDQQRKDRREKTLAERQQGQRQLSDDAITRLEDLIEAERLSAALDCALGQLSPSEREAILLVAVEGIPARQAATVLGISHVALRARLARARRRMRRLLTGDSGGRSEVLSFTRRHAWSSTTPS